MVKRKTVPCYEVLEQVRTDAGIVKLEKLILIFVCLFFSSIEFMQALTNVIEEKIMKKEYYHPGVVMTELHAR